MYFITRSIIDFGRSNPVSFCGICKLPALSKRRRCQIYVTAQAGLPFFNCAAVERRSAKPSQLTGIFAHVPNLHRPETRQRTTDWERDAWPRQPAATYIADASRDLNLSPFHAREKTACVTTSFCRLATPGILLLRSLCSGDRAIARPDMRLWEMLASAVAFLFLASFFSLKTLLAFPVRRFPAAGVIASSWTQA